jgi:hypothetical protein
MPARVANSLLRAVPAAQALMAIHSSIRNNAPSSANCGVIERVGSTDWGRNAVKIRIALGLLGPSLMPPCLEGLLSADAVEKVGHGFRS